MALNPEYDFYFKVLLLGDSGVGKSCLLKRYIDDVWIETFSTIGVEFQTKTHTNERTKCKVKLQIWDTAGQGRYRNIQSAYYERPHAIMLCFDVTDKASYDNLQKYLNELSEIATKDVPLIIVGNKCDLESKRIISTETAKDFCEQKGYNYFETSAKDSINVKEAFHALADETLPKNLDYSHSEAIEVVENQGFFSRLFNRIADFFNSIFNSIFRSTSVEVETKKAIIEEEISKDKVSEYSPKEVRGDKEVHVLSSIYKTGDGVYFTDPGTRKKVFYSYDHNKITTEVSKFKPNQVRVIIRPKAG